MLRAMLTGLGLSKPTPSSVIYSPFSKAAFRMSQQPSMFLARPLQMSTLYSTKAALAKKQFGLFGENNLETVKKWLSQYYTEMKIDPSQLTVTKMPLKVGDRFAGFSRDKLLNKHVIVYPSAVSEHQTWSSIAAQAKNQGKELGVLELTNPTSCFKVSLSKGFWFFLIPHHQLKPLHKVRQIQDLEQNTVSAGIVRKNK